jgi:CheY-like chemotaxis protein
VPERSTTDDAHRVLVVADDTNAGELLVRLVAGGGFRAEVAASPEAALIDLEDAETPFVAVLLDLELRNGVSSLRALADIRRLPGPAGQVPVVVCSWDDDTRPQAWMTGVDGYLVRPFAAKELQDLLAEAVARPEADREEHRKRQLGLPGAKPGR